MDELNSSKDISRDPVFAFLSWFCPDHLHEELKGDLLQKFHHDVKSVGERKAKRRLRWNVIRFFRPGIVFRNRFSINIAKMPMLQNYLKTSYRHILKSKVNFAFKLGGLTLALFTFMTIALYVFFQLSFDTYHDNYENIYRVNTERKENGRQEKYGIVPLAFGAILKDQFPEIASFTRIRIGSTNQIRYDRKIVNGGIFPADSSLFNVFTFHFIKGQKNALMKPNSIVLTKSIATKLFGAEDPLQKIVTLANDKTIYEITAVIDDMPSNSHFKVDGFIPLSEEHQFSIGNITSPVEFVDLSAILYVRFKAESHPEFFTAKLERLLDRYVSQKDRDEAGFKIFIQPLKDIYFDLPFKYEFTRKGSLLYLYIFIVLGIFLLVSAIISYVNLSVADFSGRSREICIRKMMGAQRIQVAIQVILETLLCCIGALVMSLMLLYSVFPDVASILEPNLHFEMLAEKEVILLITMAFLALLVLSTASPVYWLTTSSIAQSLKRSGGPGYKSAFSKTLLLVQFMISIICICSTWIISQQLNFIHTKDLGIDRKNLVIFSVPEDFKVKQMQVIKQELKSVAGVLSVSNSSFRIGGNYWKDWYTIELNGEMKSFELYEVFSDDELFKTLGMTLIEGRTFNAGLPADSSAAFVINETAVRELGWKDPIGKRIFTHPEDKGKWDGTVVGVVKDINIHTLHQKVHPTVMRLPWQNDWPEIFVYVRIDGPVEQTLKSIEKKYNQVLPGYPFEYYFVDEYYNNQYQKENRAYGSLQLGTIIIIFISSLGIFSLAMYMSMRRMKEFGIRKVLGATVGQITFLHINHFLRVALLANLMALPLAYWLMHVWLQDFAYRTEPSIVAFLLVGLVSFSLVILSAGYSSWRSGRMNPIDVIKVE